MWLFDFLRPLHMNFSDFSLLMPLPCPFPLLLAHLFSTGLPPTFLSSFCMWPTDLTSHLPQCGREVIQGHRGSFSVTTWLGKMTPSPSANVNCQRFKGSSLIHGERWMAQTCASHSQKPRLQCFWAHRQPYQEDTFATLLHYFLPPLLGWSLILGGSDYSCPIWGWALKHHFFFYYYYYIVSKAGFLCVALTALEGSFADQAGLELEKSSCLCLLNARINGMFHHCSASLQFLNILQMLCICVWISCLYLCKYTTSVPGVCGV